MENFFCESHTNFWQHRNKTFPIQSLYQLQNKRHVVTGPYNPITLTIINTVITSFPSSNLGAYEFKRMD